MMEVSESELKDYITALFKWTQACILLMDIYVPTIVFKQ